MTIGRIARNTFQHDYDEAVRRGNAPEGYGTVVDAYGSLGRLGGAVLIVEFEDGRTLSPYYNSTPYESGHEQDCTYLDEGECECPTEAREIDDDPGEWADNMSGATDWADWEWSEPVGTSGY